MGRNETRAWIPFVIDLHSIEPASATKRSDMAEKVCIYWLG
jgi:hypothetical protein